MFDVIFNSGDEATLWAEAERLGFVYVSPDGEKSILTNGPMASGGGYALAIEGVVSIPTGETTTLPDGMEVPVMQTVPGYWGRLRINGEKSDVPIFSSSIVQYVWSEQMAGWTDDGVTLAPAWVGNIGKML